MRRNCDLTTPITVQNITGWSVVPAGQWDEDNGVVEVDITFLAQGNIAWAAHRLTVKNGDSSKILRNASSTGFWDKLVIQQATRDDAGNLVSGISTPTGFDQLLAAWRAANTKNARQKALADTLLSLGVIDASLTGATQ